MRRTPLKLLTLLLIAFLVPLPAGVDAQTADAKYQQSDRSGDVAVTASGQAGPAAPGNDVTNYIDMTGLAIDDLDEESVVFTLASQPGFKADTRSGQYQFLGGEYILHVLNFEVPGISGSPVRFAIQVESVRVRMHNSTDLGTDIITWNAYLCLTPTDSSRCDYFARRYLEHHVVEGKLVVVVPKELLTQYGWNPRTPGVASLSPRLFAGWELSGIRIQSYDLPGNIFGGYGTPIGSGPSLVVGASDNLPDTGAAPNYPLKHGSVTSDLRLHWGQTGIVVGETTSVPIQIDNLASHKRLINLTATLTYSTGHKPWQFSVTPSVSLAAEKSTNLTMRVTPPPGGDAFSQYASFRIRAKVVTEPDTIAIGDGYLVAEPALDAAHNTFYLHGNTFQGPIPFYLPFIFYNYGFGWFSRADADPASPDQPVAMNRNGFGTQGVAWVLNLYSGDLPNAALLRPKEPVKVHLEFDAPGAITGHLSTTLLFGRQPLAATERDVSLASGRSAIEMDLPIAATQHRLDPNNGTLSAILRLTVSDPSSQAFAMSKDISLLPKVSTISVPLDRDFPPVIVQAPIRVALASTNDLEGFVNPGRTHVFEFDLRDEDEKPVRLALETENVTGAWTVDVQPGNRFHLGPNESVHVGFIVSAPVGAHEGEVLRFKVLANDLDSGQPAAGAWVRLIATSGVEIENETFARHSEDAGKVDAARGHGSPALGWESWIVFACLPFLRRRRAV